MARWQVNGPPAALAAGATKTFVDLATSASEQAKVEKWWVGTDATSAGTATSALRVQIGLFSAAVTTHTAVTPYLFDAGNASLTTPVTAGINTTSEGGGTLVAIEEHVLPLTQAELIIWEPTPRTVPPGSFFRIRLIAPANISTTNIYSGVMWDG